MASRKPRVRRVTFLLTEDEFEKLDQTSIDKGLTISQYIRQILKLKK